MKINKFNISQIIIIILCFLQSSFNLKLSLFGHNSYDNNRSKESNYYKENNNNNNNKINKIYGNSNRERKTERDYFNDNEEINNLEIRNQFYNHNIEPISRTYDNNNNENNSSSNISNSNKNINKHIDLDFSSNTNNLNNNNNDNDNDNDNSPKFISRMIANSPNLNNHHSIIPNFEIDRCPCANFVKCQPCGLIPDLDFFHKSNIQCPCAPKLNCPICPPLSLIHEIAIKKVFIFLIRLNKINNWLQI
jgi:hypothetical protein